MWVLTSFSRADEKYHLLTGQAYTVGRKGCDILVTNDQSISRKHASFHVSHPEANISHPHRPPALTVTDMSKLGTMVGDTHVKGRQKQVKSGDILILGTAGISKYRAVYEPFICTTSCLDPASKRITKQLMVRLGGHVVSDWRKECKLLLMNSLSVTVKVICALVSLKPVVSIQYLEDLVRCYENRTELPKADTYIPVLAESQLNPSDVSFKADAVRKLLFQGKIFIFLSPKQFKKLSLAVELAGGTPMLMEEGTDDNEDDILIGDETCVMQCDAEENTQTMSQNARDWLHYVRDLLKRNGKRMISDSELGYAVLYCSIERYCNADKELAPVGSVTSQSLSQIVPQTVPDTTEVGSVDPACTTFDRIRHPSEPSVVPETESLPCIQSRSGLVAPPSTTTIPPTGGASLVEESCTIIHDSCRKRRHDEPETLPPQKQPKMMLSLNYTSSVPVIKDEIETPKKVAVSPADISHRERKVEPHKVVLEKGVQQKAVALPDSPSPGPAAIPESPVSSPAEHTYQNDDGSSCENAPTGVKVEPMETLMADSKPSSSANYKDVPQGFLSARVDEPLRVSKYIKEDGAPCNLMVKISTSLVVSRHNRPPRKDTDFNMWNGKRVMNFKKFKKVRLVEASGLPRIIGRSDLEVHRNNDQRDVEDVFRQEIQAESQQKDANKMAKELFEWQPLKRKGKW